jgi:hypothetical protein
MTEDAVEPPEVMAALRRAIEQISVDRTDVVVEHDFLNDPGRYGWGTTLSPVGRGSKVWLWFDGFDEDLMLLVDDEYYFGWDDFTDEAAVIDDVRGICSSVLSGDLRLRREGRQRYLDLRSADGRHWTGRGNRESLFPWKRSALDRGLQGFRPTGNG